jgi:uncharacterized protein YkwD
VRPQVDVPRTPDPGRGRSRRTRYLLCGVLLVPVLTAAGLYLTRGPAPAPGGSAPAPGGSAPAPGGSAPAPGGPASGTSPGGAAALTRPASPSCGPACTGTPIHVGVARVPAHARSGRPGRRPGARPVRSSSARRASPRPSASASPSTQPAPASQQGTPADQVLALINSARASAGLPPLTITAGLDASASAHNLRMADGCGLTHQCPGEPAIGARETAAGVSWTAAGENIGEGGPEPDTTAGLAQMAVTLTQDMLNEKPPDDGHRLNILSSTFTHIGIAVYRDSSGTVWLTQDFSN